MKWHEKVLSFLKTITTCCRSTGTVIRKYRDRPNADNETILGDWAFRQPDDNTTTVIEGLRQVSPETNFDFFPFDTNLRTMEMARVKQAKERAARADLAIVVVGENSMRYMWKEKTCGENVDRYELSLVGLQQELVEEIYK
ncbi:MAG: glycoside hydrolase family 3 C-terminal domain-containing protein [Tannerellaceae bacterium]|nr:glycoside hydrolase family 3 C-terminal domain-containing protein [Tannerellaceae bacterium]MCD8264372.1 glycoside hydrolase family 3 C-terminal domain-containing protein [Tannerellaceae bacterium]